MLLKQSTVRNRPFYLGVTTLTPAVALSKDGAAFGAAAGAVTEISGGWYSIALTTVDTGTVGALAYLITGTGVPATLAQPVDEVNAPVTINGVVIQ